MTLALQPAAPWRRDALVVAVVGAGALAGVLLFPLTGAAAAQTALGASTVLALVAAASAVHAARRTGGWARGGWLLLAVACAGWGLGNAYWSWNELVAHAEVLFPSAADFGFLLFPAAGAAAIWLLPGRASPGSRLAALLDGLVVAGSLFAVSWVTTLRTIYDAGGDTRLAFVVSLAYPLGDIVLVTMVFLLATRAGRTGRPVIALLVAGLLGMAVADTLFAISTADGTYASGAPSDLGWILGFAALALAGLVAARHPGFLDSEEPPRRWQLLLPYAPFAAAVGVTAWHAGTGPGLDAVQVATLLSVFALVMIRQLVTLMHNSALTQQLRHQAFHDSLTGLANRALFADRLEHALALRDRNGRELAVMSLDLDDFKLVNDTLGHGAGDALLCRVAERLRACIRPTDTIARLGGDEFALLLEHDAHPEQLARRILEALQHPFTLGSRTVTVTGSIGIATTNTPTCSGGASSPDLLKHVDLALYAAKAQGKNTYAVFDPGMREDVDEEVGLRAALAAALAEDSLGIAYQPILDLATGVTAGVEALARWRHPTRGDIPPDIFIPVAERAGLVTVLGASILARACQEFAKHTFGDTVYLSVNVSPLQLLDPSFPDTVATSLSRHGLDPDRLVLEVTENVLVEESDAVAALKRLSRLGVRIAVDDFGAGYASLRYLYRLPLDIIKIDRGYVQEIGHDGDAVRIITTVLHIVRALGVTAVAEGIENHAQLERLRQLGCSYGQGFLLARPGEIHALPCGAAPSHAGSPSAPPPPRTTAGTPPARAAATS